MSGQRAKFTFEPGGVQENWLQGNALKAFYAHYRLLTYDPENTITKVSDSPFWVKIVN
jgi:hypothetical protein